MGFLTMPSVYSEVHGRGTGVMAYSSVRDSSTSAGDISSNSEAAALVHPSVEVWDVSSPIIGERAGSCRPSL